MTSAFGVFSLSVKPKPRYHPFLKGANYARTIILVL
jgi:hypothetical protein